MQNHNFTIEEIDNVINNFSEYDDARLAFNYYKNLNKFIEKNSIKQTDPQLYGKYYNRLIKLKFLFLNIIDDWREIEDLIKNHFDLIYEIKFYNLWEKIKTNLLVEPVLENRDKIKEEIKKILLECDKLIFNSKKYNNIKIPLTVAEWLKDYVSILGNKDIDNLKRVEYLTSGENIKKLDKEDQEKVKILFDFYENLKYSSKTKQGIEESFPMLINGKLIIFKNGEAEEISDKVVDLIKKVKINEDKNKIDLKSLAAQYPAGSLERKTIEEEIRKMES